MPETSRENSTKYTYKFHQKSINFDIGHISFYLMMGQIMDYLHLCKHKALAKVFLRVNGSIHTLSTIIWFGWIGAMALSMTFFFRWKLITFHNDILWIWQWMPKVMEREGIMCFICLNLSAISFIMCIKSLLIKALANYLSDKRRHVTVLLLRINIITWKLMWYAFMHYPETGNKTA